MGWVPSSWLVSLYKMGNWKILSTLLMPWLWTSSLLGEDQILSLTVRQSISVVPATQTVVLCYSHASKLIHRLSWRPKVRGEKSERLDLYSRGAERAWRDYSKLKENETFWIPFHRQVEVEEIESVEEGKNSHKECCPFRYIWVYWGRFLPSFTHSPRHFGLPCSSVLAPPEPRLLGILCFPGWSLMII